MQSLMLVKCLVAAAFLVVSASVGFGQRSAGQSEAARFWPIRPQPSTAAVAGQRAVAAWNALETWFGNSGADYPNIFAESLPGPNGEVQPSFVWPQGQVVRAALNLARLTGDYSAFLRTAPTLQRYLLTNAGTTGYAPFVDPANYHPPPVRWWDDNGITGLVLLQAYVQLGDAHYLQTAQSLWPFFKAGQWPYGGQRENEGTDGQMLATVSTSSDNVYAEHLYLFTTAADPQRAEYLNFALVNDAAEKAKLRAPGGLYWDGYFPDILAATYKWCDGTLTNGVCSGTWYACKPDRPELPPPQQLPPTPSVCAWMFDNTQGLMIGSDLLLYRITGNPTYLQSAITTADAALGYYTQENFWALDPWSNSNYFVALFHLEQYHHDPRIRASLEAYLERAWNEGRDPVTGLFNSGGIGIGNRAAGISSLDQASFVTLYSLLAWPRGALPDLY